MMHVELSDAEATFCDLVDAVESRASPRVIITRGGEPVAQLLPFEEKPSGTAAEADPGV